MQINPTDVAGLLAFVPASLANGGTFLRTRKRQNASPRAWAVIAAIYAMLVAEVLAKTRYAADNQVRQLLMMANEYSARRAPQAVTLLVILGLAIVTSFLILQKAPSGAVRVSTAATIAVVALFLAESVSFHGADAIFYAPAGPIVFIGWLWLACGWSSAIAAGVARPIAEQLWADWVPKLRAFALFPFGIPLGKFSVNRC